MQRFDKNNFSHTLRTWLQWFLMIHFLILNISDINKFFVCRVWEKLQTWKSSTIFLPFRSDWMKSCSRICLLNFILDRKYSSQKREENSTHWNAVSSLRDLFRRAWNLDQAYWNFHKKYSKQDIFVSDCLET